ncbi:hypothetical protein [Thermacetogenium phaeum]|uniref:hypothetical protein n=1 Tax=Thermacetogenium phaeum TaxID=85874 RepID=UPI00031A7EE8|nr:hypothetical protein [Thermacetogenium phaeum]
MAVLPGAGMALSRDGGGRPGLQEDTAVVPHEPGTRPGVLLKLTGDQHAASGGTNRGTKKGVILIGAATLWRFLLALDERSSKRQSNRDRMSR